MGVDLRALTGSKFEIVDKNAEKNFEIVEGNGQIKTCPFREPIYVKEKTGSKTVTYKINQKCTSDCALFQVRTKDDKKMIVLGCGAGFVHEYDTIQEAMDKSRIPTMTMEQKAKMDAELEEKHKK